MTLRLSVYSSVTGSRLQTRPHVQDLPVHVIACVCVLGRVGYVGLIQRYLPRVQLLGITVFFHVDVSGVDDGLGEVNHGVILLPVADDLVLLLDVDKLVAPDGRIVAFFLLSTVAKVQSALPMKRANAPEPGAAIGLRRGRASLSLYRWCTSHSTWCSHGT